MFEWIKQNVDFNMSFWIVAVIVAVAIGGVIAWNRHHKTPAPDDGKPESWLSRFVEKAKTKAMEYWTSFRDLNGFLQFLIVSLVVVVLFLVVYQTGVLGKIGRFIAKIFRKIFPPKPIPIIPPETN